MPETPAPRLRVAVNNATRNSGLAVIRALGRAGFDVLGIDDERLPLGLTSRYSSPYRLVPGPDDPAVREAYLELLREERPDALLPVGTPAVEMIAGDLSAFEPLTGINLPSFEAVRTAVDNARTLAECRRLGIPCPAVFERDEALSLLEAGGRTVVLKPRQDLGGARGVHYVSDAEALQTLGESLREQYGELVIQEYIPGDASAMRTAIVLYDRESRLLAFFTMRKLRQWPTSGGTTALGESTRDRELVELVRPFFESQQWRGAAEVEFKVDPRDGMTKLIEINPRFTAYIGFPERCGLPLARLSARAAAGLGNGDACPPYAVGKRFINSSLYLRAAWAGLRQPGGWRSEPRRIGSDLRRGAVTNSFDPRDPLPRAAKLLHMARPGRPALRRYAASTLVPTWGAAELLATARCLLGGRIVSGTDTAPLAEAVGAEIGVRHVLPVNQGRVAIALALGAMGIGEGDDVVLPSFLCRVVLDAVQQTGARPVLADVEDGLHLSVATVRRALTPATRCVIVPHLYGNVAPIDAIERDLEGTGIDLIDDAAQAYGARCAGRPVGSFGRCGIVSTSPAKSLVAPAGGLLVTNDRELYERARALVSERERAIIVARRALAAWVWLRLRRIALPLKRISDRLFSPGYTARMRPALLSNLDAAIGLAQCRSWAARADIRRARARRVILALGAADDRCLSDLSEGRLALSLVLALPESGPGPEAALARLATAGIEGRRGFEPLHHALDLRPDAFPGSEALWQRTLLVPLSPALETPRAQRALAELLGR